MQDLLVAPETAHPKPSGAAHGFTRTIRGPEFVIVVFLIYAAALALILPVPPAVTRLVVFLNAALILTYGLLFSLDSSRRTLAIGVIRDWLPLALILLAYREIGWFALPHSGHALEGRWVVLDRLVLRGGAKAVIEALGPLLPSALEIAYALVYTLAPFCVAVLYLYGHRDRVHTFLFVFTLGVLLCYAQLPFWPSEPPRVVFFGEDFPAYDTIFRRFNWWMLGNYGIHTGVFPSAHVAGAFSAAFGMRLALPEHKWVSRFLYVMAFLIAVATVYGRYHYLVDAAAGFLMAGFALAIHRYATEIIASRRKRTDGRTARSSVSAG